ncbi:hypothetical protein AaE_013797 [Aphanomyces astaci]|uniref:Uncharacterized protein n=1 Tax=Aphanomyces astaci TaxID=112090 RepID=A0A6A4Z973_APHAT|nr:hypothetical protein AaE_013797 [Aphanomyces astaci]
MNWMVSAKKRVLQSKTGRRNQRQLQGPSRPWITASALKEPLAPTRGVSVVHDDKASSTTQGSLGNTVVRPTIPTYFKQFERNTTGKDATGPPEEVAAASHGDDQRDNDPPRCIFTPDQLRLFNDGKEVNEEGKHIKSSSEQHLNHCRSSPDDVNQLHYDDRVDQKKTAKKGPFNFFDHIYPRRTLAGNATALNAAVLNELPSPEMSSEMSEASIKSSVSLPDSPARHGGSSMDYTQLTADEPPLHTVASISPARVALFFSPHDRQVSPLSSDGSIELLGSKSRSSPPWKSTHRTLKRALMPSMQNSPKKVKYAQCLPLNAFYPPSFNAPRVSTRGARGVPVDPRNHYIR